MTFWRFKPSDYAPGAPLYIAQGYYDRSVAEYTVTKVTPSGQVVAALNASPDVTIRVNKYGTIVGESSWTRRSVVGAGRAAELKREEANRRLWLDIRQAAEKVEKAARERDHGLLTEALAGLIASVDTRRMAETPLGGSGRSPSGAVPAEQGDAQ